MHILIVEDEPKTAAYLQKGFTESGFIVEVAHRGDDGLHLALTRDFDMVVLDHLMPGLLGIEIIEKWQEEGVDTPILMLSAVDDERVVVQSLELGVVDFVRKPFRLPELTARIVSRLRS